MVPGSINAFCLWPSGANDCDFICPGGRDYPHSPCQMTILFAGS